MKLRMENERRWIRRKNKIIKGINAIPYTITGIIKRRMARTITMKSFIFYQYKKLF